MGLLPLILKNVAWSHRQTVYIKRRQQWYKEIVVRALGLKTLKVPKQAARELRTDRTLNEIQSTALIAPFVLLLGFTYVILEIRSKRSSIGYLLPATIFTWTLFVVEPASMDVSRN